MAGKDDLADAVLGGASDFMADITAKMNHWAEFDQQVFTFYGCMQMFECIDNQMES